jgi:integrase
VASIGKRCKHNFPDRCQCNWVLRYRDAAGRQREESFYHDQKPIALDRKLKIEHDLRAGEPVFSRRSGTDTLCDFIATWIEQAAASPKTKRNYRSCLRQHIEPAFGAIKLHRVQREQVRKLLLTTMPKTVGHSSIGTARTVLVGSLGEAVRQKKLSENPAAGIRLPNADNQRAEFYLATHEQLTTLEASIPEPWRVAIWLMRGCGLRIGEALAIRSDSVRADMLRTEEQVLETGVLGPLKHRKPGEYRDVPLPAYVEEKITSDGYLFPDFVRGTVRSRRFREEWHVGAKAAGLPDTFRPHDLRHTWASVALAGGIPITDVSRWLGHRDINLTHRVYGHLVPAISQRAVVVIDNEFEKWCG